MEKTRRDKETRSRSWICSFLEARLSMRAHEQNENGFAAKMGWGIEQVTSSLKFSLRPWTSRYLHYCFKNFMDL